MSLEEALAANTAALEANTAAQEKVLAALKASGTKTAASKPAATAEEKKAAAAAKKAAAAAKKGPTEKELHALYSGFLSSTSDKDEKKVLAAGVKKILENFGAERITTITEDDRVKAMAYGQQLVDAFETGGVDDVAAVTFDFEDGGDDEGGDEDDVL